MILYPIETLKKLGITDILLITGGGHVGKFEEFLGDGNEFGVELTYRIQEEAGGIAQALGLAKNFVGDDLCAVILGDNVFDNNQFTRQESFAEMAHIFIKKVSDPQRFGVVEIDDKGNAIRIEEKPENPKSDLVVTGLYIYPPDVFNVVKTLKPSARGELEITDVNAHYIKQGTMLTQEIDGFWSDAGTFESLLRASNWVASYE